MVWYNALAVELKLNTRILLKKSNSMKEQHADDKVPLIGENDAIINIKAVSV